MFCLLLAVLMTLQLCACGDATEQETATGADAGLTDADIYGTWYASPEMGSAEVTINRDGTCLLNGQLTRWTVWMEEENHIELSCENGTYLSISNYDWGFPCLNYQQFGTMLRSSQLWQYRGFWETDLGDEGYIDEWSIQFSNKVAGSINEGRMEVYDEGDAVICVTTADDGTQQILRMHNVDGYSVIEMTDSAGMVHMFYDPANRPPVDAQAVMYHDAVKKLNDVQAGGRIFYEDTDKTLGGNAAYGYIYSLFEQLGDYKDSKQYLSNFKVIEDVLVDVRDQYEEFNTGLLYLYGEHDNQGRRLTGRVGISIAQVDLGFAYCGYFYELTYGEDGLISQILTHDGDERDPVTIGIPSYDEKGNMTSLDVTWNSVLDGIRETVTYTSYFTYDAQGRRLTFEIPDVRYEQTRCGRYYYDDAGKLLQITKDSIKYGADTPRVREINEYVYDDRGVLIEKRYHQYNRAYPFDWVYVIQQYSNEISSKAERCRNSSGSVYRCLDDKGNQGVLDTEISPQYKEESNVFGAVMDQVFGRESWEMIEHDYVIDTTQMALEWHKYNYDLLVFEAPEWTESEYIYTDVYLYCPES